MANPYLILWCDPTTNKLYSGWRQNTQAPTPILKQGDEVGVELHWVKRGDYTATMQEISFPPSVAITLAIGRLDSAPIGGTFKLSYGANTTGELQYDITATELETALNSLASVTADGGVSVTKSGNQFRIVWDEKGAFATALTADADALYPTTNASIVETKAGTLTANRVILLKLRQAPIAACQSWTASPSPVITSTNIFTNTWRIDISPSPKEGVFSLTVTRNGIDYTTSPISYNSDGLAIAGVLNATGTQDGAYTVIKSGDYTWDITVPSTVTNIQTLSGIVGFSSVYGVLDMNTAEAEEFLGGLESAEATLEVQADISGEIQTLIQTNVSVLNDLIDVSAFNIVELGDVMPVDSVVRYDTAQALTAAQQLQARENIAAVGESELAAVEADIVSINGDISSINAKLDQDVKTTSNVEFASVTNKTSAELGSRLIGGGFQSVFDGDGTGFNWSTSSNRVVLNAEEWLYISQVGAGTTTLTPTFLDITDGASTISVTPNGIAFSGSPYQTVPYIPADIAAVYLTQANAATTYLTQANAATTYGLLSRTPTVDEKAALAAQSYSTTPPSSTNKYLTKSDFDANFITETHTVATNTGVNHSANDVIATGIIPNPDSTKDWLVTVAFDYASTSAVLLSDVWWQDNNHELYFEEEGNLGGAQMTFARNSWQFILPAGVTGYEFWSNSNAAFVGLSGQLVVCYKSV